MTTNSSAAAEQLAVLFPASTTLHIGDRDVVVREMPVRKIARFAELLAPILARFPGDGDSATLFLASSPSVIEGLAHAVDQPSEWIGELPMREFERLVRAVQEANKDFFVTGPGLLVFAAMEMLLTAAKSMAGPTPSRPSSSMGTETPAATH
jgi:hypothetical protein